MGNIIKRRYKADMGTNFEDWANGYFSRESDNLDKFLQRDKVLEDYMYYAKTNKITMQSFSRKLYSFVQLCPWIDELNPEEYKNSSGRIQKSITMPNGETKTKDMIYLRSSAVYKPDQESLLKDVPKELINTENPF